SLKEDKDADDVFLLHRVQNIIGQNRMWMSRCCGRLESVKRKDALQFALLFLSRVAMYTTLYIRRKVAVSRMDLRCEFSRLWMSVQVITLVFGDECVLTLFGCWNSRDDVDAGISVALACWFRKCVFSSLCRHMST